MIKGTHFYSALDGTILREAEPLAKILGVETSKESPGFLSDSFKRQLWEKLSYKGSHDFAYLVRGFEGVDYPEILRDVCEKLKLENLKKEDTEDAVRANEEALVGKMFESIWEQMSQAEREELLKSMNVGGDARLGGTAALTAILAGSLGGFTTYQVAVIVANMVSRALIGRGLAFAGNAALTRGIGAMLGPVGWIASGVWLASDLASPAYRTTVPAVLQVAFLRQVLFNRRLIGVIGQAAVGKDSLIQRAFGIETGNISPIPGSTSEIKEYPWDVSDRFPNLADLVRVVNFPGFDDLDKGIEEEVFEKVGNCGLLIYMVDSGKHVTRSQVEDLARVRSIQEGKFGRRVEVVLNQLDRVDVDETTVDEVVSWNRAKLGLTEDPVCLSLKRRKDGTHHPLFESGLADLRGRVDRWLGQPVHPPTPVSGDDRYSGL